VGWHVAGSEPVSVWASQAQIEEALRAERDFSEGNPYSPVKAARFVYVWLRSRSKFVE